MEIYIRNLLEGKITVELMKRAYFVPTTMRMLEDQNHSEPAALRNRHCSVPVSPYN